MTIREHPMPAFMMVAFSIQLWQSLSQAHFIIAWIIVLSVWGSYCCMHGLSFENCLEWNSLFVIISCLHNDFQRSFESTHWRHHDLIWWSISYSSHMPVTLMLLQNAWCSVFPLILILRIILFFNSLFLSLLGLTINLGNCLMNIPWTLDWGFSWRHICMASFNHPSAWMNRSSMCASEFSNTLPGHSLWRVVQDSLLDYCSMHVAALFCHAWLVIPLANPS